MLPETAINALLNADAAVVAQVAARIWPGAIPQGSTLPAISYGHISTFELHKAVRAGAATVSTTRIQVTVHDTDLGTVKRLLRLVRKACNKTKPSMAITGGVDVMHSRRDLVGPELTYDDPDRWAQSIDFLVTYRDPNV